MNVSGADRARNLEATAHLARALPAGSRERIAVGRRPSERGLAERIQPIEQRARVGDRAAVVGEAHRREHVAHRVLEFGRGEPRELPRQEQRAERRRDVAVGSPERARHRIDELGRRGVAREVGRELARDEVRAGRPAHDEGHRPRDFGEARAVDPLPEKHLRAEIVPRRVEFECAVAHIQALRLASQVRRGCRVDSDAGQHAGELLHVLLAVAAVDAEGVQLHQLARVVLVDVADGILGVVEVLEHGRVLECREHQIAKTPERMRADRALRVISEQPALIGLVLVHAEMVEPEPHHLLAQLRRRIQRPQQLQTHRPIGEAVAFFIQRLAGLVLVCALAHRVDRTAPFVQLF